MYKHPHPSSPLIIILLYCTVIIQSTQAQSYHALNGSSYSGATSIFNNPASPVNSLHKWDLNLFSFQISNTTNTLYANNVKPPSVSNGSIQLTQGEQSRWLHQNLDISLLNAMYKINQQHAISGGLRIRTYNHLKSGSANMNDSITSLKEFLIGNRTNPGLQGFMIHTGWLEGNLNYSRILRQTATGKLSGGITLRIMKNISGAYAKAKKINYLETIYPSDTAYSLTDGSGSYAYSANYDATSTTMSTTESIKKVLTEAKSSFGLNAGIEYLIYNKTTAEEDNNPDSYSWKLGLSVMDIGSNQFNTSNFSGQFSNPNTAITNWEISQKMANINSARDIRDSMATIFNTFTALPSTFSIANPTRLVINVDRNMGNHFYINGQISLNFRSTSNFSKQNTRELSLVVITPRWETEIWGLYFPIQYNTQGQLWMGAALKAGPLVVGMHNIGLLKKDPLLNGGGYLMFSLHPFGQRKYAYRLDCVN
jgi:hypothetical protein